MSNVVTSSAACLQKLAHTSVCEGEEVEVRVSNPSRNVFITRRMASRSSRLCTLQNRTSAEYLSMFFSVGPCHPPPCITVPPCAQMYRIHFTMRSLNFFPVKFVQIGCDERLNVGWHGMCPPTVVFNTIFDGGHWMQFFWRKNCSIVLSSEMTSPTKSAKYASLNCIQRPLDVRRSVFVPSHAVAKFSHSRSIAWWSLGNLISMLLPAVMDRSQLLCRCDICAFTSVSFAPASRSTTTPVSDWQSDT